MPTPQEIRSDYSRTFDSAHGQRVLEHLLEVFGYYDQLDPSIVMHHALLAQEYGSRRVMTHILDALKPISIDDEADPNPEEETYDA